MNVRSPFSNRILCWIKFSTAKLNVHKSLNIGNVVAADIVDVGFALVAAEVEIELEVEVEDIGLTFNNQNLKMKIKLWKLNIIELKENSSLYTLRVSKM